MEEKKVYLNGIYNISNEEYHSSAGVSRSMLSSMKKTPFHYWFDYESGLKGKTPPTPAMVFGELVHTLVLEKDLFDSRFIIAPMCDRRTKEGKAIHEKFMAQMSGRQVINQCQYDDAVDMAQSVHCNEVASQLLQGCFIEQSIYFTHEPTGLQCKVRPDAYFGTIALDLKTTADASEHGFQMSAMKYDYYLQAAMNFKAFESIGIILDEFIFIEVEKETPHNTALDRVVRDEESNKGMTAIQYGLKQFDERMERLKYCKDNDIWPGYGIRELKIPKWANYEELAEIE